LFPRIFIAALWVHEYSTQQNALKHDYSSKCELENSSTMASVLWIKLQDTRKHTKNFFNFSVP